MKQAGCPLCDAPGGAVVFQAAKWRVIRAVDAAFPAFYRVVWQDHVAEFTQLSREDRITCMDVVATVEGCVREHLSPDKVNLAALGNMVPHLHWHVVARFRWDSRFPDPVWCPAVRTVSADQLQTLAGALPALETDLVGRLASLG